MNIPTKRLGWRAIVVGIWIIIVALNVTAAQSELTDREELQKFCLVGVHPFNDVASPHMWPEIVSAYHLEFLDRTHGFNATGMDIDSRFVQKADELGLGTASYFSQDPIQHQNWGFLQSWYNKLPKEKRWKYPDGTVATNPFKHSAARNILGEIIRYDVDNGRTMMSENSPAWLDYQKESIAWALDQGLDSINVDLVIPSPLSYGGDFSYWSKSGFRDYLDRQFSKQTLTEWGITNVGSFDIQQYIMDKPWGDTLVEEHSVISHPFFCADPPDTPFRDPVIREFHKFNYLSQVNYYQQLADYAHRLGEQRGQFIPFFGNLHIGTGRGIAPHSPLSVVLGQTVDIIQNESTPAIPPSERLTTICKLGLAMGEGKKPVWNLHAPFYTDYSDRWGKLPSESNLSTLSRLYIAETYAAGVIPEIDLGGWPGMPNLRGDLLNGATPIPEISKYLNLVNEHRDLLRGDLDSLGQVALVYSIPSLMWHHAPLFTLWPEEMIKSFNGYARALEHAHIPYDAVIFGHPELWRDNGLVETLTRYSSVILPQVDCLTDYQVEALKAYVKQGGTLITVGNYSSEIGKRTEDYVKRPQPVLTSLFWDYGQGKVVSLTHDAAAQYYVSVVEEGVENPDRLSSLARPVLRAGEHITSSAPNALGLHAWRKRDQIIIHLVNHNYNLSSDQIHPMEKAQVSIPYSEMDLVKPKQATLLSPDRNETKQLELEDNGETVSFTVDRLQIWDIVLLSPEIS